MAPYGRLEGLLLAQPARLPPADHEGPAGRPQPEYDRSETDPEGGLDLAGGGSVSHRRRGVDPDRHHEELTEVAADWHTVQSRKTDRRDGSAWSYYSQASR